MSLQAGRPLASGVRSRSGASAGAPNSSRPAPAAGAAAAAAAAALLIAGAGPAAPPAAAFGPVSVKLEGIQVTEVPCGSGVGTVGGVTFSGAQSKAACLDVAATANNPDSKTLYNADVFGRIYDANGEAMIDAAESIRIAYIDVIPPGKSEVHFKLFVPAEQYVLGAPELRNFKATGFPGGNLPKTGPTSVDKQQAADCEILGNCDDLELEAAIR